MRRSRPRGVCATFLIARSTLSISSRIERTRSKYARPASVSDTARVVRFSRRTPSSASRRETSLDAWPELVPSLTAAPVKERASTTATNMRSHSRRSMEILALRMQLAPAGAHYDGTGWKWHSCRSRSVEDAQLCAPPLQSLRRTVKGAPGCGTDYGLAAPPSSPALSDAGPGDATADRGGNIRGARGR